MLKKTDVDPFAEESMDRTQERVEWPFKDMAVGEILVVDDIESSWLRAQRYCNVYGRSSGKKFRTAKVDGKGYIKRIA